MVDMLLYLHTNAKGVEYCRWQLGRIQKIARELYSQLQGKVDHPTDEGTPLPENVIDPTSCVLFEV